MSYLKDTLGDDDFQQFENDMTMQDLMLEYSEEELNELYQKFLGDNYDV